MVLGALTRKMVIWLAIVSAASLAALAFLEYRWIAQLGEGERARLNSSVERSARNFRDDFNNEVAVLVERTMRGSDRSMEAFVARFRAASASVAHPRVIRSFYLTEPGPKLVKVDGERLTEVSWPPYLEGLRDYLEEPGDGPPPRPSWNEDPPAIVVPRMPPRRIGRGPGGPPPPPPPPEGAPPRPPPERGPAQWVTFEFDTSYIRSELLPELIRRHFGSDYAVEVVSTDHPEQVILGTAIEHADLELGFFEFHIGPPNPPPPGPPHEPPAFERPRWQLRIKHQSGSLEEEVAGIRRRNLGVSFTILLIMAGSIAALVMGLRRAEDLSRMQMEFVAGVSHELRTPLSVIRSAGENLADGVVANEPGTRNYGALIRDEGRRLTGIVEQILGFARAQSGRISPKLRPADVSRLVERALTESAEALAKIEVEKQVENGLPQVLADDASICNCLQNLIGNAIKYGDGEWIRIEACRAGGFVEFAVTDRGAGIDPEEASKLFDPFYRGRSARDRQTKGLGIGLNLVKRVVEAHGGRVKVNNVPGGGARFALLLPVLG